MMTHSETATRWRRAALLAAACTLLAGCSPSVRPTPREPAQPADGGAAPVPGAPPPDAGSVDDCAALPAEVVRSYGDDRFLVGGEVGAAAFDADGGRVAAGAAGSVVIFDRAGRRVACLRTEGPVRAVGFAGREALVALVGAEEEPLILRAWQGPGLDPVELDLDVARRAKLLAASPASALVAVQEQGEGSEGRVSIVDTGPWQVSRTLAPPPGLSSLVLSPDGRELAMVGEDRVTTADLQAGAAPREQPIEATAFDVRLSYAADGKRLILSDGGGVTVRDRSLAVLDRVAEAPPTVDVPPPAIPLPRFVTSVAMSSQRGAVYWAESGGGVEALDLRTRTESRLRSIVEVATGMAPSPDGERLLLWGRSLAPYLEVLPLASGETEHRLVGSTGPGEVALTRDRRLLVRAAEDFELQVWEGEAAEPRRLKGHRMPVNSLAFDRGERWLAAADNGGKVIVYDVPAFDVAAELEVASGSDYATGVAFSPAGDELWVSVNGLSGPSAILRYSTDRWRRVSSTPVRGQGASSIAAGERLVAVGTSEATVELWSTERMEHLRTLDCPYRPGTAPVHYVDDVEISADGALVAAPTGDGLVYVWDARTGAELHRIDVGSEATDVEFGPGGRTIVVAGDGLSIWDLSAPTVPVYRAAFRSRLRSVSVVAGEGGELWIAIGEDSGFARLARVRLPDAGPARPSWSGARRAAHSGRVSGTESSLAVTVPSLHRLRIPAFDGRPAVREGSP